MPPHDTAAQLIQVSLVGLGLQERYSVQAITGFLVRPAFPFLSFLLPSHLSFSASPRFAHAQTISFLPIHNPYNDQTTTISRSRSPDFLREAVDPLLRTYGRALVDAIIAGAGGRSPRSVIPNFAELMSALVMRLPEDSVGWLGAVLSVVSSAFPPSYASWICARRNGRNGDADPFPVRSRAFSSARRATQILARQNRSRISCAIPFSSESSSSLHLHPCQLCYTWLNFLAALSHFRRRSRTIKRVREALHEFALVARGLDNSAYGGAAPL
jgi:hypothetical protein